MSILKKKKPDVVTAELKPENINELLEKVAVASTLKSDNQVSQPSSNVELTNKVVDTLFDMVNSAKKKMLGILSKQQVNGIKKLLIVNDIVFDNRASPLTRIIDNEIYLSVSVSGKGREQLVKLTKVDDVEEQNIGRIKRYFQ